MVQTDLQSNQGVLFIAAYSGGEFKNIGGVICFNYRICHGEYRLYSHREVSLDIIELKDFYK